MNTVSSFVSMNENCFANKPPLEVSNCFVYVNVKSFFYFIFLFTHKRDKIEIPGNFQTLMT